MAAFATIVVFSAAVRNTTAPGQGQPAAGGDGPGLRRSATDTLQLPVPRTFDLAHVEPEHFAAALGNDPARIFNFVRDQIAFEPYAGVLRGPRGTLLAMAGNAADRASLLASLLVSAGRQVRFVRGRLPEPLARRLVASIWAERPWLTPTPATPPAEVKATVDKLSAALQHNATLLKDMLQRAGHPHAGEAPVSLEALTNEARDHYWIQLLDDDKWTAMDPSFAMAAPGQVFGQPEETFDSLPDAIFHRVEIHVRLEEYAGDSSSTRDVLEYATNAADLSAVNVFLAHQSGNGQQANRVRPLLIIGQQRFGGEWYWLKSPPQNAQAAILDAFGGSDSEPEPTATAESVEFVFIAPDGTRETVNREIFDRVDRKMRLARQSLNAAQVAAATSAVATTDFTAGLYSMFFTTGAIDGAHVWNVQGPKQPVDIERIDLTVAFREIQVAFTVGSDAVLSRIAAPAGVCRFYLDTPRIQIAEVSYRSGTPRLSLDLRRDRARALVTGPGRNSHFWAQVFRGVVEGVLERSLIEHLGGAAAPPGDAAAMSTSLVFERAQAEKTPAILLARDSAPLGTQVSGEGRARIEEALAAELLVVTPQRPVVVAGVPRSAWWQIDPRSGITTAVTDEGLYQTTVEITENNSGVSIRFTINGNRMPAAQSSMTRAQAREWARELDRRLILDEQIRATFIFL